MVGVMAFAPDHSKILALASSMPSKWVEHAEKFQEMAAKATCEVERDNYLQIAQEARQKAVEA